MIYRISFRDAKEGKHYGFEYVTSMVDARTEMLNAKELELDARLERVDLPKGKKQVIDLLNKWASHPDNG